MTDQEFSEILDLGYKRQGCKKLSGRDGLHIRLGDFRFVYEIDNAKQIVTILNIGQGREVYH
jgi:mRNA-degrading endonuclease RelE of RelBE toxin-antitoxin system